jgi:hypothetical protein
MRITTSTSSNPPNRKKNRKLQNKIKTFLVVLPAKVQGQTESLMTDRVPHKTAVLNPRMLAQQGQWRVTWLVQGEQPEVDVMNRWADAWALAQPWPEERGEDGGWLYTRRLSALEAFQNGAASVVVAWTRNGGNQTILSRA